MAHRTRATFTHKGALDTTTASSPLTFTDGITAPPGSVRRGVAPGVSSLSKRHPVPHAVCDVAPVEADRNATLSFELTDVTPPFANMLRRLILTEVPTMAIDRVLIKENDGVVLDEILSHRLGLCPIAADPTAFEFITMAENIDFSNPSAKHVLRFDLDVSIPNDPSVPPVTNVFSSSLKWCPLPGQEGLDVKLVQSDILLAKLGRGQRISLEAYAIKGLGLAHAKWAPVSACWYDMKTIITLQRPLTGDDAKRLVDACPMRVFDIENGEAYARKPEKCTLCRECVKPENEDLAVTLQKDKTHVKFTLESLGQYAHPEVIVRTALEGFASRCRNLKKLVTECETPAAS